MDCFLEFLRSQAITMDCFPIFPRTQRIKTACRFHVYARPAYDSLPDCFIFQYVQKYCQIHVLPLNICNIYLLPLTASLTINNTGKHNPT